MNRLFMTAGLIFLLAGCKQPDRDTLVKPIMDKRLHDRLNEVQTREKLNCYEALMKDALKIADSLLRENPLLIKIDSLERPAKPLKPIAPEIQKPADTVLLKPLIEPDTAIENEN